jgi:hypothetical protein
MTLLIIIDLLADGIYERQMPSMELCTRMTCVAVAALDRP